METHVIKNPLKDLHRYIIHHKLSLNLFLSLQQILPMATFLMKLPKRLPKLHTTSNILNFDAVTETLLKKYFDNVEFGLKSIPRVTILFLPIYIL
jgi:hypothetical protein